MRIKKIPYKLLLALRMAKSEGFTAVSMRILQKIQSRGKVMHIPKQHFRFLVDTKDVLRADWSHKKPPSKSASVNKKKLTLNWVMSPPGKGSGGHQNLFRFIRYLELAGHTCHIYLYSTIDGRTVSEIREVLKDSYPATKAPIQWLKGEMQDADGIFATGWETAYPVFNSNLKARRFYFVQDFEPYFYPIGSEYVLAENTYKMGLYGITAGGWLKTKLHEEYGMQTDFFEFGADRALYQFTNERQRKEIFFYARPVTARRGFELGIMTLKLFHTKHPDYVITLAGWDVSNYDIPFPYKNLKTLRLDQLSDVYNNCAAGLVMSLTNMSLLPLELLACGTIPVVNDAPNNRLVSNNPHIAYCDNHPAAMADKLSRIVTMENLPAYALKASKSVSSQDWDSSGEKFVNIVERELHNG